MHGMLLKKTDKIIAYEKKKHTYIWQKEAA